MSDVIDGEYTVENALTVLPETTHFEEQEPVWEIREGETDFWYSRFLIYLNLGPTRTLAEAWRIHCKEEDKDPGKVASPRWYEQSREWNWPERARVYDQYRRAIVRVQEEEDRKLARDERRRVLRGVGDKVLELVQDWDPNQEELGSNQVIEVLEFFLKQSRQEYGDDEAPAKRGELKVGLGLKSGDNVKEAIALIYGDGN